MPTVQVRFAPPLHERFVQECEKRDISPSEFIRRAVEAMMDHIDTPAKGVVLSRSPNMLDRREHKIEMVTVPSAARKPPEVPGVFKASEMPDAPKPAIGSTRRVMGKDPKSAAPMMLRKERLIRYDEDEAVWEAIKP